MRISFAGLETTIPDGWKDESTIVYTMPADVIAGPLIARQRKSEGGGANVSITWEDAAQVAPQRYLDDRLEQTLKALPGFRLLGTGDLGDVGDPIPCAEYALQAGRPMMQLLAVRRIRERIVVVTGTALEPVYAKARPFFVDAARALRAP